MSLQEISFFNEKYTLLCSEKCKLLNSIESVVRESKSIKRELRVLLDLIAESKSTSELDLLESESESETTNDPFYESFLNFSHKRRELKKVRDIHFQIKENGQRSIMKSKKKSTKKTKTQENQK